MNDYNKLLGNYQGYINIVQTVFLKIHYQGILTQPLQLNQIYLQTDLILHVEITMTTLLTFTAFSTLSILMS